MSTQQLRGLFPSTTKRPASNLAPKDNYEIDKALPYTQDTSNFQDFANVEITKRPPYIPDPRYLIEGNYEIGGLIFGTRDPRRFPNPYLVEAFDITPGYLITGIGGNLSQTGGNGGGGSSNTADSSLPNEDGIKFGQDYYTGMILTFSINCWQRGQQVYDQVGKIKGVWRKKEFRNTSNTSTTLRMCRGGRTRLVYGRQIGRAHV